MRGAGEEDQADAVRVWLEEEVSERWDKLVAFVLGGTPVTNPSLAPDVVQEAILRILAGKVRLPEDPKRWKATLLSTIRNMARDHVKAAKVRRGLPVDVADGRPGRVRDGTERGWRICRRMEAKRFVDRVTDILSDDQWEVVVLRYLEQWNVAEIAAHRGCSRQAVHGLLQRALATMRSESLTG